MTDITIRPAATGIRNGLPESGWYVYRGTGQDIMPWAITDDETVDETELLPDLRKQRGLS
jgi:hypothetical protein